ncbi:hypothetical protein [Nocardia sp. NPDC050435]|uniref:hypothetical protein n=1 Tax=Nocardia sp. NPDC050435 TaxID=3155040 RepID=UPI0033CBB286
MMAVEPSPDPTDEHTDALRRQVEEMVTEALRANQDPDVRNLPAARPQQEPAPEPQPAPRTDRNAKATLVSGVLTSLCTLIAGSFIFFKSDPAPPAPAPVTNCQQQQIDALKNQRENPGILFRYNGPSEEQCNLNRITEQERERLKDTPPQGRPPN